MFFGKPAELFANAISLHLIGGPESIDRSITHQFESLLRQVIEGNAVRMEYEVLYGLAGLLCLISTWRRELRETLVPDQYVKAICDILISEGVRTSGGHGTPLSYYWHGSDYLGIAHGLSGILLALLQFHHLLDEQQKPLVQSSIDFCLSLENKNGNFFTRVSSDLHSPDKLYHWCHGGPGIIHLFAKAYMIYGATGSPRAQDYLQVCRRIANAVWQRGLLKKGPGLCHGVCGNGYAFLKLSQITTDDHEKLENLQRAKCFADFAVNNKTFNETALMEPDNPYSLFEGMAAISVLLSDLRNAACASFPLFD
ncbi:hypothetical protein ACOME3_004113 [Neoechinorhynchus agilis]